MTGSFSQLKIGGGGVVSGIEFSGDGLTTVCHTDTAGAYLLVNGTWQQVNTSTSHSSAVLGDQSGVIYITPAPTNSSIVYMWYNQKLYKSTDRCSSWTLTSSTTLPGQANDGNGVRQRGQKMIVDPINAAIVLVGTQDNTNGVVLSTNSGGTWTSMSTIPIAQNYCMSFDLNGSGGATNNIYVGPTGSQMYFSNNAGSTWTATTGGPTAFSCLKLDGNNIWVCDNAPNSLWNYSISGNSWTHITNMAMNSGEAIHGVAVEPVTKLIRLVDNVGRTNISTNTSGTTWGTMAVPVRTPQTDIPWLGYTNNNSMTIGSVSYDTNGVLYLSAGIGVFKFVGGVYVSQTAGIENLVTTSIVSPPEATGQPTMISWDRMIHHVTDFNSYPTVNFPTTDFNFGFHLDYSQSHGPMMLGMNNFIGDSSFDFSCKSTDSGASWSLLPSIPTVITGTISASASSGTTLTFSSVPAGIFVGMLARDLTRSAFTQDSQVIKVTATTVDLNSTITGAVSGDTLQFRTGNGGSVAVSTTTNFMWMPSNNCPLPSYTTDGGSTWSHSAMPSTAAAGGTPVPFSGTVNTTNGQVTGIDINTNRLKVGWSYQSLHSFAIVTISSIDSSSSVTMSTAGAINGLSGFTPNASGFGNAYYDNTVCLCADSVTANTFYVYNDVTRLVYVSVDSGATFTTASSGVLSGTLADQEILLKAVPGNAGHLVLCAGNGAFMYSRNAGVDFTSFPTMTSVGTFGFGKVATGSTYPTIYATGLHSGSGTTGNTIWKCVDGDQTTPTWTLVGDTGALGLASISRLDGDKNIEGQFYGAFSGASAFRFSDVAAPSIAGFSVIHGHAKKHTKMIGY